MLPCRSRIECPRLLDALLDFLWVYFVVSRKFFFLNQVNASVKALSDTQVDAIFFLPYVLQYPVIRLSFPFDGTEDNGI